ncbi:cytochrome c biogenesis protein ResB [Ideonella sp.]|uniref:cytochrome c biogenesis protein ResB n=1 Tax=Ideonella sp. TaxID=1929293 RepID=UPI0035AF7598
MTAPTDLVDPLDALDSPPPRPAGPGRARQALELLSSMRFAITLLAVICIASVIGTVVQQNEPFNNYINKFGPFWAELFGHFQLFTVYSANWFLLMLGFLVVSTSLCIARNAPKIVADLRSFKEHVREQSLAFFHHKADATLPLGRDAALAQVASVLGKHGWRARAQVREHGTMVAARTGRASKLGYLSAHSAIVLICLGGLADGDLIVRAQMALAGKSVFDGGYQFVKDVPAEHRLSAGNPTFRGNLLVPEGARAGVALLSMPQGTVLQELPFDVELKKFTVEYYETGMPRLFASDIVIHDHETGEAIPAVVKVNEPAFHRGVAIYQSSVEDGGSQVQLKAYPLTVGGQPFDLKLRVGESTGLASDSGEHKLQLEVTGLKVINVENMAEANANGGTDLRKVDLVGTLDKHLGAGINPDKAKTLRNVGPAVTYRLRDSAGQAREFHNYMLPIELDGQRVFVAGVREGTAENFRYLRMPADENMSLQGWLRLRAALNDPALRDRAAKRYADQATPEGKPEMNEQLRLTASRALTLFAGIEAPSKAAGAERMGGLNALSQFIETSVPEAERPRIAEVMLRILNGALFDLNQVAREQAGLKPLELGPATEAFMTQAVLSLSDSFFYPAPVLLELSDFNVVQASVFQVARAPGKTLVYLGAVLLILGVFAMLYVRERRLWVWLADGQAPGTTRAQIAMSTPRRTLDIDAEFDRLRDELLASAGGKQ